jgi:pimeloyl-ACP methyl ester carboxylesterase
MPRAKINGIDICYKVRGQGEPLVLIMGYSGGQIGWMFQRRAFGKHYRVITFDNRGVGKSDKPDGAYSMRMMADDTVGLMDYLGIKKAHVLGVSMGGMIAQEIAVNYPERVGKLILGCTAAGRNESSGISAIFPVALGLSGDYTHDDVRILPIRKVVNSLCSYSFSKCHYRRLVVLLAKVYGLFGSQVGLRGQLEAMLGHYTFNRLQKIGSPTMVITGTEDRVITPDLSKELTDVIPSAKLVRFEGGSHTFFIEERARFNREVLDFLGS